MSEIDVLSRAQRIIVDGKKSVSIEVFSTSQRIVVDGTRSVSVVRGGPIGPGGPQGPQGDQGPEGPQGPAGTPAEGSFYTHVQNTTSDTWVVTHNLGYYPNVSIIDSGGTTVIGEVTHDSVNQVTIRFASAFSGRATAS